MKKLFLSFVLTVLCSVCFAENTKYRCVFTSEKTVINFRVFRTD